MNENGILFDEIDPLSGQISFTLVAFATAFSAGLDLFRYRPAASYYDDFDDINDINYWKYANQLGSYSALTIGSAAFVFQILSIFGIAVELNLLVWMWGFGAAGMSLAMASNALRYYAYDLAWVAQEDSNASAAGMPAEIRAEMVEISAMETSMGLTIWLESRNWWAAQMMALPEDKRDEYMMKNEDMLALFNF